MDADDAVTPLRPLLFSIAYRLLGSVMEAEDMVQETYLRWQAQDSAAIASPRAYLTTVITRLCLDQLRSARARRETYIGPWLPEPLLTDPGRSPADAAVMADSLSMAFLVLLERLSPLERAVFVLREVFDYDYAAIADIVDRSEAACRQLASRARRAVTERPPRDTPAPEVGMGLARRFLAAAGGGDMAELMAVLAPDVTWTSDGGGLPGVARRPIRGAEAVARFVFGLNRLAPPGAAARPVSLNGGPGVLVEMDGAPYAAVALDVDGDRVRAFYAVVNPLKLQGLH